MKRETQPVNYIRQLQSLRAAERSEYFFELCREPAEVQANVLLDIIAQNKSCEFGLKHNFSLLQSTNDYRNVVSVLHWDDFAKFSERMQKGEENLLFAGGPEHFIITSGTTGAKKLLPESSRGKDAKIMVGSLRNWQLILSYPQVLQGKFLPLSNLAVEGHTSAGIPYGSASGLATENTSQELLKLSACPSAVKEIDDQQAADYAIMRFSVAMDVRVITGNNAGRIQALLNSAQANAERIMVDIEKGTLDSEFNISADIRKQLAPIMIPDPERARELRRRLNSGRRFLPDVYWQNLKVIRCWLSGSVGRYLDQLKPLLENSKNNIVYIDGGYGASEGKFNIPMSAGNSSGPLALFSAFYEFLPADADDAEKILLAHQLEDGKEYRMFVTTYSGLYRYDMKDIIKVDGFTGATPNIKFVSKTADIGNICGEKLSSSSLIHACTAAVSSLNIYLTHFCVVPDMNKFRYVFCVEVANGVSLSDHLKKELAEKIENYLMMETIVYRTFRRQELLKVVEVVEMEKGWQKTLYAAKMEPGISVSQIKLPLIYDKIPYD